VELLYKDGCRTEGKMLSRRDHPKKKKESERVPSRKQEKYKCSIFLRE
jgi:hypothetical protein